MILIADDDSDLAENCSMMLESHGYDVSVVLSASEALARISRQRPELLISDCCMPGMTGLEVMAELHAGSPEARVIVMTGENDPAHRSAAIAGGACAFFLKPFDDEAFLAAVRAAIAPSA